MLYRSDCSLVSRVLNHEKVLSLLVCIVRGSYRKFLDCDFYL